MSNFYRLSLLLWTWALSTLAIAQTTVSGKVTDASSGESLAGVNIIVKGTVLGTISDTEGQFNLKAKDSPPLTLVFSYIGYATQEISVTDANTTSLDVKLAEQTVLGQEVVISASRVEEGILKSPVTIEQVDLLAIRQSSSPDFYDALQNIKGVSSNSGSLNMTSVNTRGFATIANVRFVQWVDGMDTQAPLLNFPTGSIMGLGELDAESMELIPGAASALYGPNAFNGILIMQSKSPFDYQGLSGQVKVGLTTSDAGGSHPFGQYAIRYAKAFNNKFAFKVNFSYMKATDWLGNDYRTERNHPESTEDLSANQDFDGLNLYGDELRIATPLPSVGVVTRTGFREEDLLDNRDAKTIKGDVALHYRITDKIEVLYNYRYGGGSSIYQGTEKYVLRDFSQQFHKVEFKGDNFFLRGYISGTDAGDSYNLTALGIYANEAFTPSTTWVPDYIKAMQGYKEDASYTGDVIAGNPASARAYADRDIPLAGTKQFTDTVNAVRRRFFQRTPPGASFFDNSKLKHVEFNYNFMHLITWMDLQVGGNYRQYDLFSDGTIFNEDPDNGTDFHRIRINEFGVYTQASKTIAEALKLTASIRYDKNENFNGQVTPRVSAVYTFNDNHNIRASFQTGFRNPDTQAQFIYFPSSSGTLLGSTKANAERYGIHNGGAYTQDSYNNYLGSGGRLVGSEGTPTGGNPSLLQISNFDYVQPEKLWAVEAGYKGVVATKLLVDLNAYYTNYRDFIGGTIVASKKEATHQGKTLPAGTLFSPYTNSTEDVKSYGVGLGITYNLPRNFVLNGSWNYADFEANEGPEFRANFNTPKNKFSVGVGNRKLVKNLGFNVNYRWQDHFEWQSSYGIWQVPEYGVVDAQVSYKIAPIKTILKVGGTNIGGGDYRTNLGAPFVGQLYYISLTFDEFLN
ncbi:TonB-dependent receptor [Chryseolinea sp. T2]|uniref:TonB-dependent receptor n=1 Tax=Chryseolinea sp. T2 TaxID=3129255 RepID=UPI0030775E8D